MIKQFSSESDTLLAFTMSGRLHDEDYRQFTPKIETALKMHGKIRMLIQFRDFHGWDAHALWDDVKFAIHHYDDIERIAMVGENAWEKWMAKVCKPFTTSTITTYDADNIDDAWRWLRDPAEVTQ